MASAEKRCLYEVLNLPTTCSADDIRSSYRRLALQRHPDKLVKSGLTQAEATASFQELVNAYDVLSDPKERSWYDSHRSQILFSAPVSAPTTIPDLFPFFSNSAFSGFSDTGKGFYNVYSSVFDKVYANEINFAKVMGLPSVEEAPILGNLDSPYYQAKSFFDYWAGFVTVLDFCWADQYDPSSGETRKSRRVMEEENRKSRKKARREYNEAVRGLAEFVKKRDKRVIDMLVKKEAEIAKRKEEEKIRLKQKEKERADRLRVYQEPEWSRIDEEELLNTVFDEENDENSKKKDELQELYCILCGKKFKSDKQWKNHEQSKKHKEKVVELRRSVVDREEMSYDGEENDDNSGGFGGNSVGSVWSEHESFSVDKLNEKLGEMSGIEENGEMGISSSEDEQLSFKSSNDTFLSLDDSDDENTFLEYMVSTNSTGRACYSAGNDHIELHNDDADDVENIIECDTLNNARQSTVVEEDGREKIIEVEASLSGPTVHDTHVENSTSHYFTGSDSENRNEKQHRSDHKSQNQPSNKKGATTQRATKNTKNSVKTSKQKNQQSSSFSKKGGRNNNNSNTCETCGCDFESRNQLHKHLGDTGHASLKYRL